MEGDADRNFSRSLFYLTHRYIAFAFFYIIIITLKSADLTGSTLTRCPKDVDYQKDSRHGRYVRFGVREHAMAGRPCCFDNKKLF